MLLEKEQNRKYENISFSIFVFFEEDHEFMKQSRENHKMDIFHFLVISPILFVLHKCKIHHFKALIF